MLSEQDAGLVEYERLRSVFEHAPVTLSVTVINAILTAFVLAPLDGKRLTAAWVAVMVIVSAVRWIRGRSFLRRRPEAAATARWAVFSVLGSLTTGMLWGFSATMMFPAEESDQLFLALVIGGMGSGAVAVNAAHLPTVLAFIVPSSVSLAASFFAEGAAWRVSSLMIVLFAAALTGISLEAHRKFGERIRLRIELGHEQRKLSETNQRLLQEIAQRQTAEATLHQAQKMEAIGHLTGGIAHDFNNLLQVMIGSMHMIRRLGADNPKIVKYADAAEQAATRGSQLTSSLLTFARRQTLEARPVDINVLLREFEPILLRTVVARVRFEMVLAADLPLCHADPAHFQSAVLNLVINACDAMPEGGALSITTGVAELAPTDLAGNDDAAPGRFVSLSVRDTGFGMTPEVMTRVFEPFFTTKGVGKGSGLGLSQIYGFARQSGGHVRLLSTPNEGTQAILWLPVSALYAGLGEIADKPQQMATNQSQR
ncbi:ATP-binding protein [Rhodopila sp.]|uniref:ATP-binding protein n=1 Tax=Rhodopila sp. TaxID=2480087 RepID=UPI003D13899B